MATVKLLSNDEIDAIPEVKVIIDDIREQRKSDFVNNFWRALANNPKQLAQVWQSVKDTMLAKGELSDLTKELIYIAVSTANGCSYCTHSHTAAAKAKGLTEALHAELLSVIALAAQTNAISLALQVPVDDSFLVSAVKSPDQL